MAAFHSFRIVTFLYLLLHLFGQVAYAAPFDSLSLIGAPPPASPPPLALPLAPSSTHALTKRDKYTLQTLPNGDLVAFSPTTRQRIPQSLASDGSGKDFDATAILWIGFCFVVGVPMAVVGVRMGRVASSVVGGGTAGLLAWASLINSLGPDGLADLAILLVVFGFFVCGFILGLFKWGAYTCTILLGVLGGLSVGVRMVLMKEGLLVAGEGVYAVNWALVGVCGVAGGVSVLVRRWERWGVAAGCACVGTFFVGLGVDLVVRRQEGMSRGLRFLFDRNSNHIVDIISTGYTPSIVTQIILGVSLGLSPIIAWAQHHFFRSHPFLGRSPETTYTDPTMGRYTSEPESIYIEDSGKGPAPDYLVFPPPPSDHDASSMKNAGGTGSRSGWIPGMGQHRVGASLISIRSSVLGWFNAGRGGQTDRREGRGPAVVVYQGQVMREGSSGGSGNVLGKVRPLRKDS